jgi:hypothetical protein
VISVSVDIDGPVKTINRMLFKLRRFSRRDIGNELSDWQTEDVHRDRPFTKRTRGGARTKFRLHSRFETKRGRRARRRTARRIAKGKPPNRVYRRWSTRPILRAAMHEVGRSHEAAHG